MISAIPLEIQELEFFKNGVSHFKVPKSVHCYGPGKFLRNLK